MPATIGKEVVILEIKGHDWIKCEVINGSISWIYNSDDLVLSDKNTEIERIKELVNSIVKKITLTIQ